MGCESGADPGFHVGGGANRPRGGGRAPTYEIAKISKKLHEIEKILGHGGGGGGDTCPLRPPKSTNVNVNC